MIDPEAYITKEGDTVDLIAFTRFGIHGSEAMLFAANPGLADYGPELPIGLSVVIPLPGLVEKTTTSRLWD